MARKRFLLEVARPVAMAMVALAVLVASIIAWSTHRADALATERQQALVMTLIDKSKAAIAHDQEASTVWDDSVRKMEQFPLDLPWIDNNLGIWFHDYYGHDRTFILDQNDHPVYAMIDGVRVDSAAYSSLRPIAEKLARQLRLRMALGDTPRDASNLTLGALDIAGFGGHTAIVSVKPIVPDTKAVVQKKGSEYLHVSVRYLDGNFATEAAERYLLDGARFSRSGKTQGNETAIAISAASGRVAGYFIWKPFGPGASVLKQIAPTLLAVLIFLSIGTALLLRRLFRNMMALQASEAQAQHLAFHDVLTGLANRALFEDHLDHALASVRRDGPSVALLYLDLDRFKIVNDTQGHPTGDLLIQAVAQRLSEATRSSDTVARLGGDEFAIILTGVRSSVDADLLAGRIIAAMTVPFDLDGVVVSVGVSIGIAQAPDHSLDRNELSRKADIALYQAKARGRGQFVRFHDAMDDDIRIRQDIEQDLRQALAVKDGLSLHYQPVIAVSTGKMESVEALIRWNRKGRGPMSPMLFIPIAEETGLIEQLGEWILERACKDTADWPVGKVAVNVSPAQLRSPGFSDRVLAIMDSCGFDPGRLEIEITETCLIDNAIECQPNISALRARGVRFALDDFGTGYSSFNHFRQLAVDRLKIDRSFVASLTPANRESPIIRAIVDLANSAGIAVTAEGVETAQQSQYLSKIGCTSLQGYHHGRPMPPAELEAVAWSLTNIAAE